MFINLAHFLIPKIFFILSYLANPIFVHLIHTEKSFHLGSYKYLLYFFAVFNMTASLADTLVPVCVHTHRYATMVFTVDGPFAERSRISEILVACRCAFISGTYGILNAHFIYRFLSLKYDKFVNHYFKPWGLVSAVFLVILHWVMWAVATDFAMGSVEESREYVRQSFEDFFNANMTNLNILVAVFSEVSPNVMYRSWFGNIFATVVSSYSIVLYFALWCKIMSYLTDGVSYMSPKTIQMQKRLFWALSIQTAIPIFVSFMPCALALYGSAFRIDFGSFSNITASITVSTFPFLDPLAIIVCLPALRRRLFAKINIHLDSNSSNQVHSVSRGVS
ncbi:Protein CBG06316 [Caenorhabditis briggsae]|uniref:Protein CBG06316 n=1 Tax=Caenorhabditis briggsae TaxID=6238 RepID=A8X1Y0_CAEBR|nr:Protein CBG06316 [Caenorhabditis briggsae]CAP26640.1 Protein CBG06316 [Caenorhabditis briggsae]